MKDDKYKLLSQVAYMYFIEDMSQQEISKKLGIYRTTISRLIKEAREEGIVDITIRDFDTKIYALETHLQTKYQMKFVQIVPTDPEDSEQEKDEGLSRAGAAFIKQRLEKNSVVGLSWGRTLAQTIGHIENRRNTHAVFVPIVGGPSHVNTRYHVNTLVYELARKFGGSSQFVNATVVQESKALKEGITRSKYFSELNDYWSRLDLAIVGIGGKLTVKDSQWRDLITADDYEDLELREAIGDCCCRFVDRDGKVLKGSLYERTIGMDLTDLAKVPISVGIARSKPKAKAILAVLKRDYINTLITDEETALEILEISKDPYLQVYLASENGGN
ncbi:DNA-binding transcriptional regulator [Bacilli bacterium]|nr:DNA-binding transcriptional regulator [Bacilli bacterium]